MSAKPNLGDPELRRYRDLLQTPTEFREGFGWPTIAGVLFCGLVMMPGSIYLGLMTGGNIGAAATWVTVILFSEVARRSMKQLAPQQLVILLSAAGAMASGGWAAQLVQRAYLVRSDAIRDAGLRGAFPPWFAPGPDSQAILQRNLFHHDWLLPIAVIAATMVLGLVTKYTLGYFFFRLASDIEQLPFPMAPIQAQGAMALAESEGEAAEPAAATAPAEDLVARPPGAKKKSERWRLFSLGTTLGIAFGLIQVAVPAITGLILDKPFFILPQPFLDTTTLTEALLPATPTGLVIDLGIVLVAMVIPFWAIAGSFIAIVLTIVLNPVLHHLGVLTRWQPGMDTINTTFANSVDFWMSFGIGAGLGIAVVSTWQTVRDLLKKVREMRQQRRAAQPGRKLENLWTTPRKGRGDYPLWLALAGYIVAASCSIGLCYWLLPKNLGLLLFLIFFAFVYNPFISYVNARMLGIAGQTVDIPFIKETAFILSGARGIVIWLAPIPIENYGGLAQSFRVNELTGVKLTSLLKLDLVVLPASFLFSFAFWAFIWASEPIPSPAFPTAQVMWDLQSKTTALLYSSTHVAAGYASAGLAQSQFMQAIHPVTIGAGFSITVLLFTILNTFGLPVMLVYGMIRGFGGLPHTMLLELVGALLGRYYFQKKFGADNFLRMVPTIIAGYFTGVGLIGMATIAMKLIQTAVSSAPF